jgi:hypothetical protein
MWMRMGLRMRLFATSASTKCEYLKIDIRIMFLLIVFVRLL